MVVMIVMICQSGVRSRMWYVTWVNAFLYIYIYIYIYIYVCMLHTTQQSKGRSRKKKERGSALLCVRTPRDEREMIK